ncbi:MAG: dephospho-CoA kinase [Deltaproteobacteria bacterium]|nr:dephospho-CoA kinase [Deltaproteobacteria bacterium]
MLFGLTGGIACGKSTVAGFLKERGVGVVDADQVAREVVLPGTEGLRAIVDAFGQGVLAADGTLDRKALGARVFGDQAARQLLNRLTHPLIRAASLRKAQEMTGFELIAYEAALLVEAGHADAFRPLVVVIADEPLQLARLMARDSLSEVEARARLAAQMPLRDKAAAADHVIDTSCSLQDVRARTDEVLEKIRRAYTSG